MLETSCQYLYIFVIYSWYNHSILMVKVSPFYERNFLFKKKKYMYTCNKVLTEKGSCIYKFLSFQEVDVSNVFHLR